LVSIRLTVGDRAVAAPIAALALRVDHVGVAEVAFFDGLAEGGEDPIGNWDLLDLCGDDFEDAGLQDHIGVGGVDERACCLARSMFLRKFASRPRAEGAADKFRAGVFEHSDVVVEITAAVEEAFHADRARE